MRSEFGAQPSGGGGVPRKAAVPGFFAGVAANVLGGVVVLLLLVFVAPVPREVAHNLGLGFVNIALFGVYAGIAAVIASRRVQAIRAPIDAWLTSGRPPTPAERELTLRLPVRGLELTAALWLAAAVLFGVFNAFWSVGLGLMVAFGIALGGLTTCAVVALLIERFARDDVAAALRSGVPEEPVGPGVATRMGLTWALGTAVPLLGLLLVAAVALLGGGVSTNRLAATTLFIGLVVLAVGLMATRVAARSVAEPVEQVRAALKKVERGELEAQALVSDGSEVGLLAAGFNRMVAGLRERELLRDLFGRHVGEDVARQAMERGAALGGELRECAILFVDLVGSTKLAANRPPDEVVGLLNEFFAIVVEAVRAHGGWVNKFEGDAALCVFGAPAEQRDAAGCALAAARALAERLDRELPELEAGIGVSAGPVVAGNVGAKERFEYTLIGDPVNEAARLTELAKLGGGVLASEAALARAGSEEEARWRLGDEVVLRGRGRPSRLATPVT